MSPLNIEIKAKFVKNDEINGQIQSLGFYFDGIYDQVDTYFNTNFGRLKLRQQSPGSDCLIFYDRENKNLPKESRYQITDVINAEDIIQLLRHALGILVVVKKKREFWLWKNVRVFFDDVEHLGSFIELEAVCSNEIDATDSFENVKHLMGVFKIQENDLIAVSYSDLMILGKDEEV